MGLRHMSKETWMRFLNPVKSVSWFRSAMRSPMPVLVKPWNELTYAEQQEFEGKEGARAAGQWGLLTMGFMLPAIIISGIYSYNDEIPHLKHIVDGHIPEHRQYEHCYNNIPDFSWCPNDETSLFFNARTQPMPNSKMHAQHMPGFLGFDDKGWPIFEDGYDNYGNPV